MQTNVNVNEIASWWGTEECMTSEDVAKLLGIQVKTFYQYRYEGKLQLPHYAYGKRKYFKRSDVLQAIAKDVEFSGMG